ncbi:MAG TPA: hypothetical protein VKY26_12700 [Actinomycetota bacterium]|nr:hypothetical protein [Actinomycetota bacterium]
MSRSAGGRSRIAASAATRWLGCLAVVLAVLGPALTGAQAGRVAVPPTRVQVVAMEYYFILSRRSVASGPAIVQLVDFGQDPHDLRLQRVGGGRVYGTPVVQPGGIYDLDVNLQPGTYELWCSIANHRALGMQAKLVVRPRA